MNPVDLIGKEHIYHHTMYFKVQRSENAINLKKKKKQQTPLLNVYVKSKLKKILSGITFDNVKLILNYVF